jgi:hypothetical protein
LGLDHGRLSVSCEDKGERTAAGNTTTIQPHCPKCISFWTFKSRYYRTFTYIWQRLVESYAKHNQHRHSSAGVPPFWCKSEHGNDWKFVAYTYLSPNYADIPASANILQHPRSCAQAFHRAGRHEPLFGWPEASFVGEPDSSAFFRLLAE